MADAANAAANAAIADELKNLNSILETLNTNVANMNAPKPEEPKGGEDPKEEEKPKIGLMGKAIQQFVMSLAQLPAIFAQQSADAQKFAQTANMSYAEGLQATIEARTAQRGQAIDIVKSIFTGEQVDFDKIVRQDQIRANMEGFISATGGFGEGFRASTQAFQDFTVNAKSALGTEQFRMTADVVRAMGVAGLGSTQRLEEFRKATGLRSLSDTMMASVVNKNVLAFQLFGDSFAKTAVRAERLGVSLQAATQAATSNVMNAEGMLDTVNQLNALGANIDFTELLRLQEFEGARAPEKILEYLRAVTPTGQFSISSFRGIFEGLGFNIEDVMKMGGGETPGGQSTMESTLAQLDATLRERLPPPGKEAELSLARQLATAWELFKDSAPWLTSLLSGLGTLTLATIALKVATWASVGAKGMPGGGVPGGMMSRLGGGLLLTAGLATVATGVNVGANQVAKGNTGTGAAIGLGLGAAGGAMAGVGGAMLAGATVGSTVPVVGTIIGALVGLGGALYLGNKRKKELEEQRAAEAAAMAGMAPTPTSAIAATVPPVAPRPGDMTVQQGTQFTQAAQTMMTAATEFSTNASKLVTKTQELIDVLKLMNMPELTNAIKTSQVQVNVDGTPAAQVPRVTLTGVNIRRT